MAKRKAVQHEDIEPFKNTAKMRYFENELLNRKRKGTQPREIWLVWQIGKVCLLRVSDVIKLRYRQIYDHTGEPRTTVVTHDKKTKKYNPLDLRPLRQILIDYRGWLKKHGIKSSWLVPSYTNPDKPVARQVVYRRIKDTADFIGFHHISCHSCRKTGAYILYKTTNNLAMVSHILNHSSLKVTEKYLGITDPAISSAIDSTDWDSIPK